MKEAAQVLPTKTAVQVQVETVHQVKVVMQVKRVMTMGGYGKNLN